MPLQHDQRKFQHKHRHKLNWIAAYRALNDLANIKTPQEQFYFLRGLDPFVFEEMILTALKRKGHGIIRNTAYTGDGGADGCVFVDKVRYLIQAKRYRGYIKAKDVEAFAKMCHRRKAKGLFVHTGKTGKKSRNLARQHAIEVVSGQKLLTLFAPETINLTVIANTNFVSAYPALLIHFNRCA